MHKDCRNNNIPGVGAGVVAKVSAKCIKGGGFKHTEIKDNNFSKNCQFHI